MWTFSLVVVGGGGGGGALLLFFDGDVFAVAFGASIFKSLSVSLVMISGNADSFLIVCYIKQ